jgi:phospholipid/cholesterol/gamma-HCH transport system substrate-binding protein
METRANYALIGLFTLAVLATGFLFVFWFSGGDRGQGRQPVRVVFSGSVSGLSKGSVVSFNGIRVGEVTELRLLPEDPRRVLAIVEVDRTTPVRTDTRARLEFQGLTGVAGIALVGGEAGSPPLQAGPADPLPTIFADRSDFQDLMESARNVARRADEVLERISKVVTDNEGSVSRTMQNVERFSVALGSNAPAINRFLEQVGQAAERVGPLAGKLEILTDDVQRLVRAVEPQRVSKTLENVESFTGTLAQNRDNVTNVLRDAALLAQRLNDSAGKFDTTLTDVSAVVRAVDAGKLNRTIEGAERFATSLGKSSADVEKAIQEARSLTEKLNKSADRVDGVLKAAEGFLGSASGREGEGAFGEVRNAAQSVRVLADNLDKRTADIAAGINRFAGSGLREVEALTTEGRRTLNDIGRTVRNLERNPQQVITGGRPNIPEYNGRR